MPTLPGARSGRWEYQRKTRIGLVRIRQDDSGLWASYLLGHRWLADFRDPDSLADALACGGFPFPPQVAVAGDSSSLNLPDNLGKWDRVRAKCA